MTDLITYLLRTGMSRVKNIETARSRYTDFFVTVDTHVASADDAQDKLIGALLLQTVRKFCTPAVLKQVLITDNPNKLRMATLTNASVEIGEKYKRIHVHFNISLLHETFIRLAANGESINTRVANWFDSELEDSTGKKCYASVRLSESSRAKNYAIKHGATLQPIKVSSAKSNE